MSGKLRGSSVECDNSTEEDETYEPKYRMRLREPLRNSQQQPVADNETTVLEPRRRGRGPSKRPCLNRNALMARENRLRKKAYLEKVENKLAFYQQENKNLVNVIKKQGIDIKRLSGEVAYLRSVLNNNTSITGLLKTINDGLHKMNAQRKNSFHPNHVTQCSDESDTQHKCTCHSNVKNSILNAQKTNMFITNLNNDPLLEQSVTENQSNDYINTRRQINYKHTSNDKTTSSFLDSDHSYTLSKNSIVDTKNNLKNQELTNAITSTTSSISEDSYLDSTKDLDQLLPLTDADLPGIDLKKEDGDTISINDLDQLSVFNMDIFEDLPKCDEILNTVDNLSDTPNPFTEEEILQSLDNTGICLHVNSDKISLEFCSICRMNSKNSGLN